MHSECIWSSRIIDVDRKSLISHLWTTLNELLVFLTDFYPSIVQKHPSAVTEISLSSLEKTVEGKAVNDCVCGYQMQRLTDSCCSCVWLPRKYHIPPCPTDKYLKESLLTTPRNQAELELFPVFSLPEKKRLMQRNTTRFGPRKIWQESNDLTFDLTIIIEKRTTYFSLFFPPLFPWKLQKNRSLNRISGTA